MGGFPGRWREATVLALLGVGAWVAFSPKEPATQPSGDVPLSVPRGQEAKTASSARAAVVIDGATGKLLYEQASLTPYPVASLTKLASAMVVLDRAPDLNREATILPTEYTIRGGNLRLGPGERVTLRDLLLASITGSANNAAFALPRVLGMTDEAFAEEMNRKAVSLGLETVRFVDSAGFSPENVGGAYDVARLAAAAFRDYPLIAEAAARPTVTIRVRGLVAREHVLRHSNQLFEGLGPGFYSKTGYLHESLFCLVLARRVGDRILVAVVLGHPDEYGVVQEAQHLLETAAGAPAV